MARPNVEAATTMKHGDFTGLARDYATFRPGYAPQVATAILGYLERDSASVDAADVGAGTGIWTRILAARGLHSVIAVEPNDDMLAQGIAASCDTSVTWRKGSAEATGLPNGSVDLVTMAASFHWADFDKACDEFHRILRPRGLFVALWNPPVIAGNALLLEIAEQIIKLKPDTQLLSTGRTERLTDLLSAKSSFTDVLYLECRHSMRQTPAQYLGSWRSGNDLQFQLGPQLFQVILDFIAQRTAHLADIETTYLTRAWAARRA